MPQESIEHLLTVLRGKMQTFEETEGAENIAKEWHDMLAYLQSWIDEYGKTLLDELTKGILKKLNEHWISKRQQ